MTLPNPLNIGLGFAYDLDCACVDPMSFLLNTSPLTKAPITNFKNEFFDKTL